MFIEKIAVLIESAFSKIAAGQLVMRGLLLYSKPLQNMALIEEVLV